MNKDLQPVSVAAPQCGRTSSAGQLAREPDGRGGSETGNQPQEPWPAAESAEAVQIREPGKDGTRNNHHPGGRRTLGKQWESSGEHGGACP